MFHAFIIIAIITGIKAIFSAADTAFTYLNKAEINQLSKKMKKARKIKYLMEESNKFFGVIEVGTNLAELSASAYASVTILNTLTARIEATGIAYNIAIFIAAFIITIALSYVLLIFGGVLPKRYARKNPRKVAFTLINLIWVMAKINYPFERIISWSIEFFSKLLKLHDWPQEKLTDKQLKMIITEGRQEGVINGIEKKILFNALKLDDIPIKRIVIPIDKVDCIEINQKFEDVLENIEKYRFTRIPVYVEDKNNIIGILNIKDIVIGYAQNRKVKKDFKKIIRKVVFIDSDEKILDVFKKMQEENQMIAAVKNKKDKIIGIVSMEDILEKIVGKISDEYDEKRNQGDLKK